MITNEWIYFKTLSSNTPIQNLPLNIFVVKASALPDKEVYRSIYHFFRQCKYSHLLIFNDINYDKNEWKKIIKQCTTNHIPIVLDYELNNQKKINFYTQENFVDNIFMDYYCTKFNSDISELTLSILFYNNSHFEELIDILSYRTNEIQFFSDVLFKKFNIDCKSTKLLELFFLIFITSPGKKASYIDCNKIKNNSPAFKQFVNTSLIPLFKIYKQNQLLHNPTYSTYKLIHKDIPHKICAYQYENELESMLIIINLSENNYIQYNIPVDNYFSYTETYTTSKEIKVTDHEFCILTLSMPKYSGIILKSKKINLEILTIKELKKLAKKLQIPAYSAIEENKLADLIHKAINEKV